MRLKIAIQQERARSVGLDDHLSWALIPVLGVMVAASMLHAIVYGLMPDDRWNRRFNASASEMPSSAACERT